MNISTLPEQITRGEHVLNTLHSEKYSPRVLMNEIKSRNFQPEMVERTVSFLRNRRQALLRAAWAEPFNVLRWLKFQFAAFLMLNEMQEIFIEIYRLSGSEDVMQHAQASNFASTWLIKKMLKERQRYLEAL